MNNYKTLDSICHDEYNVGVVVANPITVSWVISKSIKKIGLQKTLAEVKELNKIRQKHGKIPVYVDDKGKLITENILNEQAPADPEIKKWISTNRKRFKRVYGEKDGERILMSKAWQMQDQKKTKQIHESIKTVKSVVVNGLLFADKPIVFKGETVPKINDWLEKNEDYGILHVEKETGIVVAAKRKERGKIAKSKGFNINEEAPPDAEIEKWIKSNKNRFKKEYGEDGEKILYAKAWKMYNLKENFSINPKLKKYKKGHAYQNEDGHGRFKVNYIHPNEKNIGNDRFETIESAIKYAKELERKGYKDINITESVAANPIKLPPSIRDDDWFVYDSEKHYVVFYAKANINPKKIPVKIKEFLKKNSDPKFIGYLVKDAKMYKIVESSFSSKKKFLKEETIFDSPKRALSQLISIKNSDYEMAMSKDEEYNNFFVEPLVMSQKNQREVIAIKRTDGNIEMLNGSELMNIKQIPEEDMKKILFDLVNQ